MKNGSEAGTPPSMASRALVAREEARRLWEKLKGSSPSERRSLVEGSREVRSWALAEVCCRESVLAAADNADRALDLAWLAMRIAELTPLEVTWRWRLQGYCWAHVANARRVKGDLPGADEAFAQAAKLWKAGMAGDPGLLDDGRLLHLEASLRREQGRAREALILLDRALAAGPQGKVLADLLLNKAITLGAMDDHDGAISTLHEIPPVALAAGGARSYWVHQFTMMTSLCGLDRYGEAEAILPELRVLAGEIGNDLDSVRLRWWEGQVAAGRGRQEEAITALSRVREEFAARDLAYDTALATLELAALYLEEGRSARVRILAREMGPIFIAQRVHRHALAALKLFCDAAKREKATAALARHVLDYLRRAQHDPTLPFRRPAAARGRRAPRS